jgi:hypothetical protein
MGWVGAGAYQRLLAPDGVLYLVALEANRPHELVAWLRTRGGLDTEVVLARRAGREALHIIRAQRPAIAHASAVSIGT